MNHSHTPNLTPARTVADDVQPPSIADALRQLADRAERQAATAPDSTAPDTRGQVDQASAAATVREFLDAYTQGDLDTAADLVTDEFTYRIPGRSRIAGIHHGRTALRTLADISPRPGARDLASATVQLIATPDGGTVVSFHTLTGLLDNEPIEIETSLRFGLDDGRIQTITEYTHHPVETDNLFAR